MGVGVKLENCTAITVAWAAVNKTTVRGIDPAGIQGTASVGPLLFGLTCSAPVLINNTYFEFKQRQRGRGFTAILSFKVVKDRNFCFRCYLHMYILVTRSVLLSSWLHDENTDTQV